MPSSMFSCRPDVRDSWKLCLVKLNRRNDTLKSWKVPPRGNLWILWYSNQSTLHYENTSIKVSSSKIDLFKFFIIISNGKLSLNNDSKLLRRVTVWMVEIATIYAAFPISYNAIFQLSKMKLVLLYSRTVVWIGIVSLNDFMGEWRVCDWVHP